MSDRLLEAVRALRVADPDLGQKPLLAKLREQQPDLGAGTKEVREALAVLKAESEARAATDPPTADEGDAPSPAALSLACIGCARLPSEMDDDRDKHPVCHKCVKLKVPTSYWCGLDCPGNPGAWELHAVYHKKLKKQRKKHADGSGAVQQLNREAAEEQAWYAAQSGDKYDELLTEGIRYSSKQDYRKAAKSFREAIALIPEEPVAYFNLGNALANSGHTVEAVQRYLEAKERHPVGSEYWAQAMAKAFDMLRQKDGEEVAKPEWWNDEELKALSARVARAAPNDEAALSMRAMVLCGWSGAWETKLRSAVDLQEAASHYERAAVLSNSPGRKAELIRLAGQCRSEAEAM